MHLKTTQESSRATFRTQSTTCDESQLREIPSTPVKTMHEKPMVID
jgi:hypothetical protein